MLPYVVVSIGVPLTLKSFMDRPRGIASVSDFRCDGSLAYRAMTGYTLPGLN